MGGPCRGPACSYSLSLLSGPAWQRAPSSRPWLSIKRPRCRVIINTADNDQGRKPPMRTPRHSDASHLVAHFLDILCPFVTVGLGISANDARFPSTEYGVHARHHRHGSHYYSENMRIISRRQTDRATGTAKTDGQGGRGRPRRRVCF